MSDSILFVARYISPHVLIYNVADPTSPEEIASFPEFSTYGAFAAEGDYVYIGTTNEIPVKIIDMNDPGNPQLIAEFEPADCQTARAILIEDHRLHLLSSNSLYPDTLSENYQIFDVSDPVSPVSIGFLDLGQTYGQKDIAIHNNYSYLVCPTCEEPYTEPYINDVRIVDISNPSQLTLENIVEIPGYAYDIRISDNFAYVSAMDSGLFVLDLSDPVNPAFITPTSMCEYTYDTFLLSDTALVADGLFGLKIINFENPETPELLLKYGIMGAIYGLGGDGDYLYEYGGIYINVFDISNPQLPSLVSVFTREENYLSFKSAMFCGGRGYMISTDRQLTILDMTDPANIEELGCVDFEANSISNMELALNGDYLYIFYHSYWDSYPNQQSFWIADVSNPVEPEIVAENTIASGTVNSIEIDTTNNLLIQAYGWFAPEAGGVFSIFDLTDPLEPVFISQIDLVSLPRDLILVDDIAFLLLNSWLYIIDISDPENPQIVTTEWMMYNCHEMYYKDDYIYALFSNADEAGMYVINVEDTSNPFKKGTYPLTPDFDYSYIYCDGNFAYVSEDYYTLLSLDCSQALPVELSNPKYIPSEIKVYPPHPNPFNPTATITFDLPVAAKVKFDVFDITGRNVVPTDRYKTDPYGGYYSSGTHSITFDGSDLASGIYLYRLTAGEQIATGKMVLLK